MNALEISNLTKIYNERLTAVDGVDLTVESGDFFALLGPNGAGKSTIIGITSSLVNKTSGKVKIYGHDLDTDINSAKACMGLVPQEINFNQFEKVSDIVVTQAGYYGIPAKIAKERAEFYLNKLDLWKKRNTMSRHLSGGMKRRLMIARALIHQPKMLILDEPTAGVDIELRHSTWKFLQEINQKGTTIILTTHYLEEAEQLCRGIAFINHGKILQKTTVKQFLNQAQDSSFILDLLNPITSLPKFTNYTIEKIDSQSIEVSMPKAQTINDLFKNLSQHNIEVTSMRNKTNRLEELFVKLIHQEP